MNEQHIRNKGRASQLLMDGPEGTASIHVILLWLVKVAYFLLNRYIHGD